LALLPFRSVTSSYGQLGSKAVAAGSSFVFRRARLSNRSVLA
jgi:hypothetical protein